MNNKCEDEEFCRATCGLDTSCCPQNLPPQCEEYSCGDWPTGCQHLDYCIENCCIASNNGQSKKDCDHYAECEHCYSWNSACEDEEFCRATCGQDTSCCPQNLPPQCEEYQCGLVPQSCPHAEYCTSNCCFADGLFDECNKTVAQLFPAPRQKIAGKVARALSR